MYLIQLRGALTIPSNWPSNHHTVPTIKVIATGPEVPWGWRSRALKWIERSPDQLGKDIIWHILDSHADSYLASVSRLSPHWPTWYLGMLQRGTSIQGTGKRAVSFKLVNMYSSQWYLYLLLSSHLRKIFSLDLQWVFLHVSMVELRPCKGLAYTVSVFFLYISNI